MINFVNRHRVWVKVVATVVVCLFAFNTISWAAPNRAFTVAPQNLQVQSMIKPIVNVAGWEKALQIKLEFMCILAMAFKAWEGDMVPYYDINARLDDWVSVLPDPKGTRLLDVVTHPRKTRDGQSLEFTIALLDASKEVSKFSVRTTAKSLYGVEQDENVMTIEAIENIDYDAIKWPDKPSEDIYDLYNVIAEHTRYVVEVINVLANVEQKSSWVWGIEHFEETAVSEATEKVVPMDWGKWLVHGEAAPFATIAASLSILGMTKDVDNVAYYIKFKTKIIALSLLFDEVVDNVEILDAMPEVQWTKECPVPYEQTGLYLLKGYLTEDREEKLELIRKAKSYIAKSADEIEKAMQNLFPGEDFNILNYRRPPHIDKKADQQLPVPEDSVFSLEISGEGTAAYATEGNDEFIIGVGTFLAANSKYHPDLKISTEPGLTTCTGICVKAESEEGIYYGLGRIYLSGDGEKDQTNLLSHVMKIRGELKKQGFKSENMEFFIDYRKESYGFGFANEMKVKESMPGSPISFNRRLLGESSITVTKVGVIVENNEGRNVAFKWAEQLTYGEEAAKDAAEHLGSIDIHKNVARLKRRGEKEEILPIFRIHSQREDRTGFGVYRLGALKEDTFKRVPLIMAYSIPIRKGAVERGLRGVLIARQHRHKGFLRHTLNTFFKLFPEVRRTHALMENLILQGLLVKEYGFLPEEDGIEPNSWIKSNDAHKQDSSQPEALIFFPDEKVQKEFKHRISGAMYSQYLFVDEKDDSFRPVYFGHSLIVKDEKKFNAAILSVPVNIREVPDMVELLQEIDPEQRAPVLDVSFEIGQEMGDYGHKIDGGKSTGRSDKENREIIMVDFEKDRILRDFYESFLSRVRKRVQKETGDQELANMFVSQQTKGRRDVHIPGNLKGKLVRFVYDTVMDMIVYDGAYVKALQDKYAGKSILIGDAAIGPKRGVCRHHGIVVASILEKLIEAGYIRGQVFYVRNTFGPGHGWAEFRDSQGNYYVIDVAQGYFGPKDGYYKDHLEDEADSLTVDYTHEVTMISPSMYSDRAKGRSADVVSSEDDWDESIEQLETEEQVLSQVKQVSGLSKQEFQDFIDWYELHVIDQDRQKKFKHKSKIKKLSYETLMDLIDLGKRYHRIEARDFMMQTLSSGVTWQEYLEKFHVTRSHIIMCGVNNAAHMETLLRLIDQADDSDVIKTSARKIQVDRFIKMQNLVADLYGLSVLVSLAGDRSNVMDRVILEMKEREKEVVQHIAYFNKLIQQGVGDYMYYEKDEVINAHVSFWKDMDKGKYLGQGTPEAFYRYVYKTLPHVAERLGILQAEILKHLADNPEDVSLNMKVLLRRVFEEYSDSMLQSEVYMRLAASGGNTGDVIRVMDMISDEIGKRRLLRTPENFMKLYEEYKKKGVLDYRQKGKPGDLFLKWSKSGKQLFSGDVWVGVGNSSFRFVVEENTVKMQVFDRAKDNMRKKEVSFTVGKKYYVGRSATSGNDYVLREDTMVSGVHFSIEFTRDSSGNLSFEAIDHNSLNGTRVEWTPQEEQYLDEEETVTGNSYSRDEDETETSGGGYSYEEKNAAENERNRKNIERAVKVTGRLSQQILFGRDGLATYLLKNKGFPIDVVVDLSLISKEDLAKNVETWAYLIMRTRDFENVNFIFETPYAPIEEDLSAALARDLDNAPSAIEVVTELKFEIESKFLGLGLDTGVKNSILGRINAGRRINAVEIPITSKARLKWLSQTRKRGLELEKNQYPIAMDKPTFVEGEGVALRNFEAALTIGLSKAAMVIAKGKNELDVLIGKGRLLDRLNELYGSMFLEHKEPLTEDTLVNMISSSTTTRINLAISLALPPITRGAVRMLRELHDNIQLALMAA